MESLSFTLCVGLKCLNWMHLYAYEFCNFAFNQCCRFIFLRIVCLFIYFLCFCLDMKSWEQKYIKLWTFEQISFYRTYCAVVWTSLYIVCEFRQSQFQLNLTSSDFRKVLNNYLHLFPTLRIYSLVHPVTKGSIFISKNDTSILICLKPI